MKNIISVAVTMLSLLLVTFFTVLYSDGWRLNLLGTENQSNTVVIRTGMLAVRSIPDGAKVYLDNELITATDDTISSLKPQKYNLKVEKEGFEPWTKEITVYPELVTDITAILVLQSPRLEPLTYTDVKAFDLSTNQNTIAFLTSNHEEPGVWTLPLSGNPLNVFRNSAKLLIEDSPLSTPSLGESVWWSPDDEEILVKMNTKGYLLYNVARKNSTMITPQSVGDGQFVFDRWHKTYEEEFSSVKIQAISNRNIDEFTETLMAEIEQADATWSPDEEKLFYFIENPENPSVYDLTVINAEIPLPVSEKRIYTTIKIESLENTKVYWYSDSYHLILVESVPSRPDYYTVSLIRIDGTNQTPIYTGRLDSDQAYPTPSGDKIVVLTSLKDNSPANLYAIVIR